MDDIVIEEVGKPAKTMAAIEAQTKRSPADNQILARRYVKQGDLGKANPPPNSRIRAVTYPYTGSDKTAMQ